MRSLRESPEDSRGLTRIAVVGTGSRGAWAVGAIGACRALRLVALVDSTPARSELVAHEHKLHEVPHFEDLRTCLSEVDPHAVAVFTPDGSHADIVIPALDAGKWVFVEKPLEITVERCRAIEACDRRAGGRTFLGLNLRYAPVYVPLRELIDAGVLGRVLTIQADEFYDGGRTYFRRWNRWSSVSGGLWITKACHDFDLLYWMANAEPLTVHATAALTHYLPRAEAALYCRDCAIAADCADRYDRFAPPGGLTARLNDATERATGQLPDLCLYNSDKDQGAFDHGAATVHFANGVVATYTLNVVAGFTNRRMRISGTRATVDADLESGELVVRHRDPFRLERFKWPRRPSMAAATIASSRPSPRSRAASRCRVSGPPKPPSRCAWDRLPRTRPRPGGWCMYMRLLEIPTIRPLRRRTSATLEVAPDRQEHGRRAVNLGADHIRPALRSDQAAPYFAVLRKCLVQGIQLGLVKG